jgi:hypothetical protein
VTERRSSVAWTGGCRRGPQVGEQQGMKRELAVLLLGPEVDGGRRSMVSSMRNTMTEDCSLHILIFLFQVTILDVSKILTGYS